MANTYDLTDLKTLEKQTALALRIAKNNNDNSIDDDALEAQYNAALKKYRNAPVEGMIALYDKLDDMDEDSKEAAITREVITTLGLYRQIIKARASQSTELQLGSYAKFQEKTLDDMPDTKDNYAALQEQKKEAKVAAQEQKKAEKEAEKQAVEQQKQDAAQEVRNKQAYRYLRNQLGKKYGIPEDIAAATDAVLAEYTEADREEIYKTLRTHVLNNKTVMKENLLASKIETLNDKKTNPAVYRDDCTGLFLCMIPTHEQHPYSNNDYINLSATVLKKQVELEKTKAVTAENMKLTKWEGGETHPVDIANHEIFGDRDASGAVSMTNSYTGSKATGRVIVDHNQVGMKYLHDRVDFILNWKKEGETISRKDKFIEGDAKTRNAIYASLYKAYEKAQAAKAPYPGKKEAPAQPGEEYLDAIAILKRAEAIEAIQAKQEDTQIASLPNQRAYEDFKAAAVAQVKAGKGSAVALSKKAAPEHHKTTEAETPEAAKESETKTQPKHAAPKKSEEIKLDPEAISALLAGVTELKMQTSWKVNPDKDKVEAMQAGLVALGYKLPAAGVDGKYGPETKQAVAAFAKDRGLSLDGSSIDKTAIALLIGKEVEKAKDAGTQVAKTEPHKANAKTEAASASVESKLDIKSKTAAVAAAQNLPFAGLMTGSNPFDLNLNSPFTPPVKPAGKAATRGS